MYIGIISFIIGVWVGFGIFALISAASKADEREERLFKEYIKNKEKENEICN